MLKVLRSSDSNLNQQDKKREPYFCAMLTPTISWKMDLLWQSLKNFVVNTFQVDLDELTTSGGNLPSWKVAKYFAQSVRLLWADFKKIIIKERYNHPFHVDLSSNSKTDDYKLEFLLCTLRELQSMRTDMLASSFPEVGRLSHVSN